MAAAIAASMSQPALSKSEDESKSPVLPASGDSKSEKEQSVEPINEDEAVECS
jgi:hypothetical protein